MEGKIFGTLIFLILLGGSVLSYPLTQDEINPENSEAGESLFRVKKGLPVDDIAIPLNPQADDNMKGQTAPSKQYSSVILDLKETSDSKDKPDSDPITPNDKFALSQSSVAAVSQPKTTSSLPKTELTDENEPSGLNDDQIPTSENDDQLTRNGDEEPRDFEFSDNKYNDNAENTEDIDQHQSIRQQMPPAMDSDFNVFDDSRPPIVMSPRGFLAVRIPKNLAEGSQGMSPSQFLHMASGGRGPMRPQRFYNEPAESGMHNHIMQQLSDMKQVLMHIVTQQGAVQDALYRIESHMIN